MSFRSLKKKQEACTYRLNRAALIRMEEGRRKAWTKDEYYDDRKFLIKVGNKRSSWASVNQSYSQSENDETQERTEEESVMSQERAKLKKSLKQHKQRGRDNASISSKNKKLGPLNRRKASATSYRETGVEDQEGRPPSARRSSTDVTPKRKNTVNKKLQTTLTTSAAQRPSTASMGTQAKLRQIRSRTSTSSYSSDQQIQERTRPQARSKRMNKTANITWTAENPKRKQNEREEDGKVQKVTLFGTIKVDPTDAAETEPKPLSAKRNERPTSQTDSKKSFDETLLVKQQKLNEQLYNHLKGVMGEPSVEALVSRESVKRKGKTSSARASSRKRSAVRASQGSSRRLHFKPLTSAATVTSDQEEVISKWRKRLGTTSPPAPSQHNIRSSVIASSFLRDSQVLNVQNTRGNESYLIPERDSQDISMDDVELKKTLRPMTAKYSNEVFSAAEEQEIFLKIEIEKTKKQIHYLEELARAKIQKLEAIRLKKKRALEEEAALNEKLEKLLLKIQELRESDSFAKLLDKQTQVFATKKLRPNVK